MDLWFYAQLEQKISNFIYLLLVMLQGVAVGDEFDHDSWEYSHGNVGAPEKFLPIFIPVS